jgi:hypothetical protein
MHEGGRGVGRGRGRGDRGRGDRRGGGRFRGRGRGSYQSGRFPHGSHGAASFHDTEFDSAELAAIFTARARKEEKAAAPGDASAPKKDD